MTGAGLTAEIPEDPEKLRVAARGLEGGVYAI
jgi:hypothetical protein